MFLADNRRTAWIKSRKSLLPFKGQQQYEEHRVRVLSNKEVCFDSYKINWTCAVPKILGKIFDFRNKNLRYFSSPDAEEEIRCTTQDYV